MRLHATRNDHRKIVPALRSCISLQLSVWNNLMRFEILSVVLMLHFALSLICTELAILKSTRRNVLGDSNIKGSKEWINPLNAELYPIYHLLALLGAHHILHVSRARVKYNVLLIFLLLCKFWYVLAYNNDHISDQLTKCFVLDPESVGPESLLPYWQGSKSGSWLN